MKRLILPLALLAALSCSDSTEPNVFGSLTFSYAGGGGGTFTAQGGAPSFGAPSTTVSWAVGYTETGETFVAASKPRSGQNVDMAILRIQRTSAGSEPIDTGCDEDGDVACTVMVLFLNFNGNGDTGDFFCTLTSGTIVITEISASRAKGTFSGSGTCVAGTGGAASAFTVTNGAFDVAVAAGPVS
jgi:hypothetical protein